MTAATPKNVSCEESSKTHAREQKHSSTSRHSYVRFWPSDWKAGTGRIPRLHRSVYHDICCEIWDFNAPVRAGALSLLLGDLPDWQRYVNDLVDAGKLVRLDDGSITNARAAAEAHWAYEQWEKRSFGGKGGRSAKSSSESDARVMQDSSNSHSSLKARDNQNHIYSVDANASTDAISEKTTPKDDPKPAAAIDVAKAVFDAGTALLIAETNRPMAQCRSLIGKWRKQFGDGIVLTCLARAEAKQPKPSNIIEWMNGALEHERGMSRERHDSPNIDRRGPTERAAMAAFGQCETLDTPPDPSTEKADPQSDRTMPRLTGPSDPS